MNDYRVIASFEYFNEDDDDWEVDANDEFYFATESEALDVYNSINNKLPVIEAPPLNQIIAYNDRPAIICGDSRCKFNTESVCKSPTPVNICVTSASGDLYCKNFKDK